MRYRSHQCSAGARTCLSSAGRWALGDCCWAEVRLWEKGVYV